MRRSLENPVSFQCAWRRRSVGLRPNRFPDVANGVAAIIPPDAWGCILAKSNDRSARRRGNGNSSVKTSCGAIGPTRPIIGVDGGPGLLPSPKSRTGNAWRNGDMAAVRASQRQLLFRDTKPHSRLSLVSHRWRREKYGLAALGSRSEKRRSCMTILKCLSRRHVRSSAKA